MYKMMVDIQQDRKVIIEKYDIKHVVYNYLIEQLDGCIVDDLGVGCKVYLKDNIALFEENPQISHIRFYIKQSIWDKVEKDLNYNKSDVVYFISNVFGEYFTEQLYNKPYIFCTKSTNIPKYE